MTAVFRREMRGFLATPVGYVFLIMYTLLAGVVTVFINIGQEMSASVNLTLSAMQLPFLLISPLLTMRMFAEERRMRTDQLLLTAPVRVSHIVLGKMLSAMAMLLLAMGLSALYPLVLSRWAQISFAESAAAWLGYWLLDVSMLSVGALISSLCVNQITAAILTLGVNVFLYLSETYILPQMNAAWLRVPGALLGALPSSRRLGDFANGIISLSDTVYFLAFTALMLFFTVRVIEGRRHAKGA